VTDTAAQQTGVPAPKPTREEELLAQFPADSIIMFTRTEFAGQQGVVLGTKSVGLGQTYLSVRVTHFKNGTPRPEDRQKELLTLPTSVEHYTPPVAQEGEGEGEGDDGEGDDGDGEGEDEV
jgi:hypothetical protein